MDRRRSSSRRAGAACRGVGIGVDLTSYSLRHLMPEKLVLVNQVSTEAAPSDPTGSGPVGRTLGAALEITGVNDVDQERRIVVRRVGLDVAHLSGGRAQLRSATRRRVLA